MRCSRSVVTVLAPRRSGPVPPPEQAPLTDDEIHWYGTFAEFTGAIDLSVKAEYLPDVAPWSKQAELARQVGLSPRALQRRLARADVLSYSEYVEELKIWVAIVGLVQCGMSVEVVGRCVGYRSASGFRAAFKRHIGIAPRDFVSLVRMHELALGDRPPNMALEQRRQAAARVRAQKRAARAATLASHLRPEGIDRFREVVRRLESDRSRVGTSGRLPLPAEIAPLFA